MITSNGQKDRLDGNNKIGKSSSSWRPYLSFPSLFSSVPSIIALLRRFVKYLWHFFSALAALSCRPGVFSGVPAPCHFRFALRSYKSFSPYPPDPRSQSALPTMGKGETLSLFFQGASPLASLRPRRKQHCIPGSLRNFMKCRRRRPFRHTKGFLLSTGGKDKFPRQLPSGTAYLPEHRATSGTARECKGRSPLQRITKISPFSAGEGGQKVYARAGQTGDGRAQAPLPAPQTAGAAGNAGGHRNPGFPPAISASPASWHPETVGFPPPRVRHRPERCSARAFPATANLQNRFLPAHRRNRPSR